MWPEDQMLHRGREDPAAAGIRRFFSLEQRVKKKKIGPHRSRSRRCPPPVVVVVVVVVVVAKSNLKKIIKPNQTLPPHVAPTG